MAKEQSMVESSEKGKQDRKYFIEYVYRAKNQTQAPMSADNAIEELLNCD